MTSTLIVRADDFGSFPEADAAIVDCCRRGIARNVSVMAPAPAFARDAAALRETGACIGLHIAMSCEWADERWGPLTDPALVPSLVDARGHFLADPGAAFRRGLVLDELMREAQAQLDASRAARLDVRYVDEHMGVGWWHAPGGGERFADRLRAWATREGLVWHGDVVGDGRALNGRMAATTADAAIAALDGLPDGAWLLLAHPGACAGAMARARIAGSDQPAGAVARERAADADLLRDPRIAAAIAARGVRLGTYADAARAAT